MTTPWMSAVVAVDRWDTGGEIVESLRRQTLAPHLEVVVVGPGLAPDPGADRGFASLTTVDHPIHPLSTARARGIEAANAPLVYVAETHGFPRPNCLDRLRRALRGGAVAAMPRIVNANPGSARSWASIFTAYGAFTGASSGTAPYVALHNGAFRRDFLARLARNPSDLAYGVGISGAIRDEGLEAVYVADAEVDHLNIELLRGVVIDTVVGGRLWAGLRSQTWSPTRRIAHAVLFPAGAAVMASRILSSAGWRDSRPRRPRGTTALVLAWSLLQSVGECAGYAAGVGNAEERHLPLELHRRAYMR